MKVLPVSADDLQLWGLILDGFPEATGSRLSEYQPDPLISGGLWAVIPISRLQLSVLLTTLPIVRGAPGNAWDRIDEFQKHFVTLDAWRFGVSWLIRRWAVRVGFIFGEGKEALWVQGVKWYSAKDLMSAHGAFNLALRRGESLPPLDQRISTHFMF